MERYFFHLEDGKPLMDTEGTELQSLEAAKNEAVQLIAQTLCNAPSKFWDAETYRVSVTDQAGLMLLSVELVATLSPALSQQRPAQANAPRPAGPEAPPRSVVHPGRAGSFPAAMSSPADEYRESAKEMVRRATEAASEEERQEYLRLAASWSVLAADADRSVVALRGIVPFAEPAPNPLAEESDF